METTQTMPGVNRGSCSTAMLARHPRKVSWFIVQVKGDTPRSTSSYHHSSPTAYLTHSPQTAGWSFLASRSGVAAQAALGPLASAVPTLR
jgi:hypothetical protein